MKILRNITNISSGASLPRFTRSHTGSPQPDTPFLIQPHPPHQYTPLNHLRWAWSGMRQATLFKCHCCVCVCACVSALGWQRNNNNPACPTSFIRLHKLIRPQRSHHLLYWEWRGEHWQEVWDLSSSVPTLVCMHVERESAMKLVFDVHSEGYRMCVSFFDSICGTNITFSGHLCVCVEFHLPIC